MKHTPLLLLATLFCIVATIVAYQIGGRSSETLPSEDQSIAKEHETQIVPLAATIISESEQETVLRGVAYVKEISEGEDWAERFYNYRQYLENLTPENALEMLAELEELRPSGKRNKMMGLLFTKWGEVAGPMVLEYAKRYSGQQGMLYQSSAIEGWAKNQPVEAWKTMMDLTNNGFVWMPRITHTVTAIALKNPALAVQLIQDVDEPYRQPYLFQGIVDIAADRGEMHQLLAQIETVENSKKQGTYLETLFKEWGQFDNETSLAAANALADPELVESATKGLLKGWAQNDGQGALEYAIQNSEDPLFKEIAVGVAQEWVRSVTSENVGEFIATLSAAPNRDQMMDRIIYQVAMADPEQALLFAASSENAASKGNGFGSVLASMSKTNPERVTEYYRTIEDDEVRWQSTWAATTSSIYTGASAEDTLSLLSTFKNEDHRNSALDYMVLSATFADHVADSGELRSALVQEIGGNESMSPETRKRLLDKLKVVGE